MTPSLESAPAADSPQGELLEMALMVAESSWRAKEYVAAKRAAKLALSLDPSNVTALSRLGRIALIHRQYGEAMNHFGDAYDVRMEPASAVNLSIALGAMGLKEAALHWCDMAIASDRAFLPAYIHKAAVFEEAGELDRAERTVRQALAIFPDDPDLVYSLSLYELKRGDCENGWANYEQRPPRRDLARKLDEYPEWRGEDLAGRTILVCGEQGLGDQIMFARYIPLLRAIGANVVLFTMPGLSRLFASAFPDVRILASDAELKGLEPDCWVAIGSLPFRWGHQVETPQAGDLSLPYLWPDRADTNRLSTWMPRTGRLRVGLCWKGNPEHRRDRYRSIRFADLKPLLEVPGVDFYSLQRGDTESGLVNLTAYCHDLADTAAAIGNLDLVITVDTAMLHLAGAIGKPVWGLIYTPGDWRWGGGNETATPWYASVRLIRQEKQLDWSRELQAIASDLRAVAAAQAVRVEQRGIQAGGSQIEADGRITRLCRYGTMTWLRNDHYIGRALDLYGEYSESEAALLRRVLKPGDTVVEAGANVGGLTLAMARAIGKSGVVHAFEPQPAYMECLRMNALRARGASSWFEDLPPGCDGAFIVPYHAALGSAEGKVTMRRVEEEKIHAPGWPSTGPDFEVTLTTVDANVFDACHLIKIDVDGPEHDILRGAEGTIDRTRPLIYVEYDKPEEYPELLPWLHGKGYRLYRHSAPLFNPENYRASQVNVFGSLISLMVLAVPSERKDLHPVDWGLERIQLENQ